MRSNESLLNFATPVELILKTPALVCPISTEQQYRFKYPYLKVMEISNACQVLLSAPAAGNGYQRLGNRGVALTLGQILLVQPGEVYQFDCRLQLGEQLVLWNHPDLHWLAAMNAGAIAPIVRVLNQAIPAEGEVSHYLWVDPKVCSVEFHFWFGPSAGGPYSLSLRSMMENPDYSLAALPISGIQFYTAAGILQNSEHAIGLNKCSTVLPALYANVAQSRVFGRWIRIDCMNLNFDNPGELTQINIKLNQH